MKAQKNGGSQGRLTIAISLCILSILTTFLIAYLNNRGERFWVVTHPVAAGSQLSSGDLQLRTIEFSAGDNLYLTSRENPIGGFLRTQLGAGYLIGRDQITRTPAGIHLRDISLPIQLADLPVDLAQGDLVSLYQVHDLRNGESGQPPELIIADIFLTKIGGERTNFSGSTSITVTTDERNVERILSGTTSGRIVVVASHG
jgi:hypothetical protein